MARIDKGAEAKFWEFMDSQGYGDEDQWPEGELPDVPDPEDEDLPDWVVKAFAEMMETKKGKLGYVDTDPDPSPKPGATRLRRYWTRGPGAAKIRWGVAGDFKRCVRQLREHVGAGAEGLCNVYHRSATGHAPGQGPHAGKALFDMNNPTYLRAKALIDGNVKPEKKREPFHGDVKSLEFMEMTLYTKGVRRVRTPAGVRRFKQPIGSIIVRDGINLSNLKINDPIFEGWDSVTDSNGKKYDVGKDEDGKWKAFGEDDWDDLVAVADDEETLYEKLNDSVTAKKKPEAKKPAPKKKPVAKKPEPKGKPDAKPDEKPDDAGKTIPFKRNPPLPMSKHDERNYRLAVDAINDFIESPNDLPVAAYNAAKADAENALETLRGMDDVPYVMPEQVKRAIARREESWAKRGGSGKARNPEQGKRAVADLKPGDPDTVTFRVRGQDARQWLANTLGEDLGVAHVSKRGDTIQGEYYTVPADRADAITGKDEYDKLEVVKVAGKIPTGLERNTAEMPGNKPGGKVNVPKSSGDPSGALKLKEGDRIVTTRAGLGGLPSGSVVEVDSVRTNLNGDPDRIIAYSNGRRVSIPVDGWRKRQDDVKHPGLDPADVEAIPGIDKAYKLLSQRAKYKYQNARGKGESPVNSLRLAQHMDQEGWGKVAKDSPLQPYELPTEEAQRLKKNSVPGLVTALRQKEDGSFDLNGNYAVRCWICNQVFIGKKHEADRARSSHQSSAHDVSDGPLLPGGNKTPAKKAPRGKTSPKDLTPGDYVEGDGFRGRVTSVDGDRVITDAGTMRGPVSRIMKADSPDIPTPQRLHERGGVRGAYERALYALEQAEGSPEKAGQARHAVQEFLDLSGSENQDHVKYMRDRLKDLGQGEAKAARPTSIAMRNAQRAYTAQGGPSASQVAARSSRGTGGVRKRYIRTEAGKRRYGGQIGDVIGKAKIKKGQTLSELAKEYYGDASKWKLIAKASGIKDPKKIPVGTELTFPEDPDNPSKERRDHDKRSGSTAKGGTSKRKTTAKKTGDAEKIEKLDPKSIYYVAENENLEGILRHFYGNTDLINEVVRLNDLKGRKVPPGTALVLPNLDPTDIYPKEQERAEAEEAAEDREKKLAPPTSPRGGKRKNARNGYVYYSDGAIWHKEFGWIRTRKANQ